MRLKRSVFLFLAATALPLVTPNLGAQTPPAFDTSGNAMLNGTWYFREVITLVADTAGDVSRNLALYGTISFSGTGSYTITNGTVADTQCNCLQTLPGTGTYSIMASGYGYMSSPISSGDAIYGLVSHGVFIGSTTEGGFNDLFIAAQIPSPLPSNSTFQGSWTLDGYFLPPANNSVGYASDLSFQISPDASGNVGTVNINGYFGAGTTNGSAVYTQNSPGVKYSISSGAVVITFPTSTTANFYSGGSSSPEYLYFSPDGNFVFGGSPVNFDMIVGVRNNVGAPNFGGLYYQAGINHDFSSYTSAGFANLNTFYGSFNTAGSSLIAADRVQNVFNTVAYNATYQDSYTANTASYTNSTTSTQYVVADNGLVRIGFGVGPFLGLTVALQAPALTPSAVYINPNGIFNAATFAPFNAGMAPGEIIVIYGSNMAPSGLVAASKLPLPTTLNGVQVLVDGVPAPIYYVSPGQLSIQVPYANPFAGIYSYENIQVSNNGILSNAVTEYLDDSLPGVFGGIGTAAVTHANNSVVTSSNPAQPGETVQVYMTGLGVVTPAVADGAAAPNPPAYVNDFLLNKLTAYVGGNTATIQGAVLAPTLVSVDQVNVTIPANATLGNNTLQIFGPDSGPDKTPVVPDRQRPALTVIPVGSSTASPLSISTGSSARVKPGALPKRKLVCFFGTCSANQSQR